MDWLRAAYELLGNLRVPPDGTGRAEARAAEALPPALREQPRALGYVA